MIISPTQKRLLLRPGRSNSLLHSAVPPRLARCSEPSHRQRPCDVFWSTGLPAALLTVGFRSDLLCQP